jgi:hypothetical protein
MPTLVVLSTRGGSQHEHGVSTGRRSCHDTPVPELSRGIGGPPVTAGMVNFQRLRIPCKAARCTTDQPHNQHR